MNVNCLKKISFVITLSLCFVQATQLKAMESPETVARSTPTIQSNSTSRAPSRNQELNGNNLEGLPVLSFKKAYPKRERPGEEAFFRSIEAYEDNAFMEKVRKNSPAPKLFEKLS